MILSKFYTDVMGVSAAVIGTIMMLARFVDAFTDVTMGRICDRSKIRPSGKFKPWLLRMCVPVAIASFLMYQSGLAGLPTTTKVVYLAITYILWGSFCYTGINIPYGSMASAVSSDPGDRQSLSTFRTMGGMLAGKVSSRAQITGVSIMCLVLVLLGMFLPSDVMVKMLGIDWATLTVMTAQVPVGIFALILVGLCTSVMWGGIFNLAVEGLGKYTPLASGIFMTLVCGGGILPFVQGFVADFAGYIGSYWVIVAGLLYMLFYALVGSKNVNTDIKVD